MSRSLDNLNLVSAELDYVASLECLSLGNDWLVERYTEVGSLLVGSQHVAFVGAVNLKRQTVSLRDESIAEVVVEMSVSGNEVYGLQLVSLDIFLDSQFLSLVVGTTVDDDTFLSLVAHNIAVLLQHVACESLYLKHILFFFCLAGPY